MGAHLRVESAALDEGAENEVHGGRFAGARAAAQVQAPRAALGDAVAQERGEDRMLALASGHRLRSRSRAQVVQEVGAKERERIPCRRARLLRGRAGLRARRLVLHGRGFGLPRGAALRAVAMSGIRGRCRWGHDWLLPCVATARWRGV